MMMMTTQLMETVFNVREPEKLRWDDTQMIRNVMMMMTTTQLMETVFIYFNLRPALELRVRYLSACGRTTIAAPFTQVPQPSKVDTPEHVC